MTDEKDALLSARRHIDDSLDALDSMEQTGVLAIFTAVALTMARLLVNKRLSALEVTGKGQNDDPRA